MARESERVLAYRRTAAIAAVIVALVVSFLIVKPFIIPLISAAILAYLFSPVYRFIIKIFPKFRLAETLSAILTIALIIVIVIVPLGVVVGLLSDEIRDGYAVVQRLMANPDEFVLVPQGLGGWTDTLKQYKPQLIGLAGQGILWLQRALKSLPGHLINLLITIFATYYFLKGGRNLFDFFQEYLPLPDGRYKQIFKKFGDLSRGYLLGQIVVGLAQGLLAWVAYYFLGIPNPLLWGILTALVSMIPLFGAALVWVPLAFFLFVQGTLTGDYSRALILALYGFFVISLIDNILKPKIVGDNAQIHPLVILLGILGGLQLIGLPGILIGPLVLALFEIVLEIYREVV